MSLENNKRQVFAEGGFLKGPFKLQEEVFDEIELMCKSRVVLRLDLLQTTRI